MLYAIGVTRDGTAESVYGWIVRDGDSQRYGVTLELRTAYRVPLSEALELCPRLAQAGFDSPIALTVAAWIGHLTRYPDDLDPEQPDA